MGRSSIDRFCHICMRPPWAFPSQRPSPGLAAQTPMRRQQRAAGAAPACSEPLPHPIGQVRSLTPGANATHGCSRQRDSKVESCGSRRVGGYEVRSESRRPELERPGGPTLRTRHAWLVWVCGKEARPLGSRDWAPWPVNGVVVPGFDSNAQWPLIPPGAYVDCSQRLRTGATTTSAARARAEPTMQAA